MTKKLSEDDYFIASCQQCARYLRDKAAELEDPKTREGGVKYIVDFPKTHAMTVLSYAAETIDKLIERFRQEEAGRENDCG